MKKNLILAALLLSFSLSWCISPKSNILSFEQSLIILQKQADDLLTKYDDFIDLTWTINHDIKIDLSSLDTSAPTKISIQSIVSLNLFQQNYNSLVDYDVSLFDKTKQQKIISSWDFYYSNIEYVPYFKLNKFSIDMWTWNVESKFLQALLGWVTNQRIMVDIQDKKNLIQNYVDLNYVLKDLLSLGKCELFYKIRNTIYRSKRSYKIWLNLKNIENCMGAPFNDYTWIVFEWFLTPINNKQVSLEIKKLLLPGKKDLFTRWIFDHESLTINTRNTTTKTTNYMNIKYDRDNDRIIFESKDYNYQINIKKHNDGLDFDWRLIFKTDNQKQLAVIFDTKWNLSLQNTWYLDIKAPQNYIIMSQLLWDKFSLKNIIWQ